MLNKIPNYIKYIFSNFFLLIVFNAIFRIIFYTFFAELETASLSEIQKAFWLGIRFDIKLASIAIFPLSLLVLIANRRFFQVFILSKTSKYLFSFRVSYVDYFLFNRFWILWVFSHKTRCRFTAFFRWFKNILSSFTRKLPSI